MNAKDVETLIEWLGPDGAAAGLEGSHLTVAELTALAAQCGLAVEKRMRRSDIVNEIVNHRMRRIDKEPDELLMMSHDDLRDYFEKRRVSTTELLSLLIGFNIRPHGEAKNNLTEFAAREISDLGMYERVARGKRS